MKNQAPALYCAAPQPRAIEKTMLLPERTRDANSLKQFLFNRIYLQSARVVYHVLLKK